MEGNGWILLHRKIRSHWIFREKRTFSRFEAWIDLLLNANYKDEKFMLGSSPILIKRGSFHTSELKLSEKWGWSRKKVRSFLDLLESENMILKKGSNKGTTITIVNYDKYQTSNMAKEIVKETEETAKKEKKQTPQKKQEKLEIEDTDFDEFWSIYPRKIGKQRAKNRWATLIKEGVSSEKLIKAAKNYAAYCEREGTPKKYIKHPTTFLSKNRDYEDFLEMEEEENENKINQPNLFDIGTRKDFERKLIEWINEGKDPDDFVYAIQ